MYLKWIKYLGQKSQWLLRMFYEKWNGVFKSIISILILKSNKYLVNIVDVELRDFFPQFKEPTF